MAVTTVDGQGDGKVEIIVIVTIEPVSVPVKVPDADVVPHSPDKADPACEIVNFMTHESMWLPSAHIEPPHAPEILLGDGVVDESQLVMSMTIASMARQRAVMRRII